MKKITKIAIDLSSEQVAGMNNILKKYQGKKLNIVQLKEILDEIIALTGEVPSKDKQIKLMADLDKADIWQAMGIKIPETNIKYAKEEELTFSSDDEALQYLADITNKKIKIKD
jgi:hypothetical protein